MKIKQIAAEIEKIAPLRMAQDWDNVGLLIGDADRDVKNILVTIDITKAVIAEAKKARVDMILSYHPVIWSGLKNVTTQPPGNVVYEIIGAGISVFSIHTAFDAAGGGVNDLLAQVVGLDDSEPIGDYVESPAGDFYKIVVFVPADAVNKVANAMFSAGGGAIGNYDMCSFRGEGIGTFRPLVGSRPAIGTEGKLERVKEIKLESVVSAARIGDVVKAMGKAHPYETPAFDVVRHYDMESKWGLGRIGKLTTPAPLNRIIANIKKATGAGAIGLVGPAKRTVKTAAVCAGSCGKMIRTVITRRCDLYLTGELKHHEALAAQEAHVTCICLSHTVSERFALKNLAKRLQKQLKDVTIKTSKKDADPFTWKEI